MISIIFIRRITIFFLGIFLHSNQIVLLFELSDLQYLVSEIVLTDRYDRYQKVFLL